MMKKLSEMEKTKTLVPLRAVLKDLKGEGKVSLALLYGSYKKGQPHSRSDIDLALYLQPKDEIEEMEIMDRLLMSTEKEVSILRLHDEEESPFVVQEALKGEHLVEPDWEIYYSLSHRILHECEGMRFRREMAEHHNRQK
jgi:predicted nucleotidyltransferase